MRFVVRRSAQAVLTILAATVVVFTILYVLPGDPIRALFGFRPPPPQVLEDLKRSYGLDRSYVEQYLRYLGRLLTGDLGISFRGRRVADILAPAIPRTLMLLAGTAILEAIFATAVGLISLARIGGRAELWSRLGGVLIMSIPVLVIATLSQAVLGIWLGVLPAKTRDVPITDITHWVLPMAALALWFGSVLLRQIRSDVASQLHEPYIKTAHAKGLTVGRIRTVHALRPAAGPTLNLAGAQVGELLGALIIVEGIFEVGGLGSVVYEAILSRDQSVVLGAVTAMLIAVIVATAAVDILSGVLDPRIRDRTSAG